MAAARNEEPTWHGQISGSGVLGDWNAFIGCLPGDTLIKIRSVQHCSHNLSWKIENMFDVCGDVVF